MFGPSICKTEETGYLLESGETVCWWNWQHVEWMHVHLMDHPQVLWYTVVAMQSPDDHPSHTTPFLDPFGTWDCGHCCNWWASSSLPYAALWDCWKCLCLSPLHHRWSLDCDRRNKKERGGGRIENGGDGGYGSESERYKDENKRAAEPQRKLKQDGEEGWVRKKEWKEGGMRSFFFPATSYMPKTSCARCPDSGKIITSELSHTTTRGLIFHLKNLTTL